MKCVPACLQNKAWDRTGPRNQDVPNPTLNTVGPMEKCKTTAAEDGTTQQRNILQKLRAETEEVPTLELKCAVPKGLPPAYVWHFHSSNARFTQILLKALPIKDVSVID